ncbi:MAG TPA: cation diffusion facilitator family transporter [Rubrobacteraceae bacterium]|nr:cation diffusion facilitator family transporter [Rubrobacteraceae bacterium]
MAAGEGKGAEEQGTRKSVFAAFTANLLITISKFVAGFVTGSAVLLAEGAHSIADTINQVFLLVSLRSASEAPDDEHPFGHGKDRFFWSLLVAVGLFVAGAVFSFYEGINKILSESEGHSSFLAGYIVLAAAFVFEGSALAVSAREFRRTAREAGHSFWNHFRTTRNTTMKVPLYEDVAALIGILIAATGLLLTRTTGSPVFDGAASIGIGVVLIFVAWELGTDSRRLLIGEAMPKESRDKIEETMLSFSEVTEVLRLLTMHLGPNSALLTAEIHVQDGLDTDQIEDLLERITQKICAEVPEVTQTFIELHPEGETGGPSLTG